MLNWILAGWWNALCAVGLHGVWRVQRWDHECSACYRLRWKRGLYPGPFRR